MAATANSPSQKESPRIRTSSSGDIEELVRVINAAFVVERMAFDGDRVDAEKVRAYMDKGTFLIAEDESGSLGCVYIELRGERGYLGLLSVKSTRQGSGLGSRVVAAAEDFARSKGARAMDLRVISPRAELLPFYRRLGYEETGTAPFPPDLVTKVSAHYILLSKPLV
jgi:GNAT superfamily N-acetyltransferase